MDQVLPCAICSDDQGQSSKNAAKAAGLPNVLAPYEFHSCHIAGFCFFLHEKKLYKTVSSVMEGFWLVGELESCLSVGGLEAAGAPLDAAKQPKQK